MLLLNDVTSIEQSANSSEEDGIKIRNKLKGTVFLSKSSPETFETSENLLMPFVFGGIKKSRFCYK